MVQAGESLLTIIPTNESKYKMSLAVPNAEAGKISVGDKVDLSFTAFPKQSFGSSGNNYFY
ncbi:Colicin V secretion protein CvaA [compost metagenome]